MSATNRGAERREHDFYATPSWCTKALFQHMDELRTRPVLDPCAGDGAILDVAQGYRLETHGIEIRDVPKPIGVQTWSPSCDALDAASNHAAIGRNPFRDCNLVTNPPYSLAQDFIEAWRGKVKLSAWLLRLNFLGSQKRAEWFRRNPPSRVLILPRRPSFTGGATDSCEYAWFVWNSETPRNFTFIDWLEVTP